MSAQRAPDESSMINIKLATKMQITLAPHDINMHFQLQLFIFWLWVALFFRGVNLHEYRPPSFHSSRVRKEAAM